MIAIELNNEQYTTLIHLLNEAFYSTTDVGMLRQINDIYKVLKFKSETWLDQVNI